MKRMIAAALLFLLLLSVTACDKAPSKESTPLNAESKAATEITVQANAEVYQVRGYDISNITFRMRCGSAPNPPRLTAFPCQEKRRPALFGWPQRRRC